MEFHDARVDSLNNAGLKIFPKAQSSSLIPIKPCDTDIPPYNR